MRSLRPILTAALFSFAFQGFAGSAEATEPIGMLRCNVSGGVGFVITSDKALACIFRPEHGKTEYYVGTIRRFGLDIGVTGPGRLAWGVFGASTLADHYPLAGEYVGATAELSFGPGVGANALVGGNDRSIVLQPLSVNAQTGIDLAAGVGDLILEAAEPPRQ
ncbi:MAG: DUF992 domain-containing protein [Beijerinckiaceae bacterium]